MTPGVAVELRTYARHLVNVNAFACTLEYPAVSPLVTILPGLERLDVHITGHRDIAFLMVDRDVNRGEFKKVKMLRAKLHADDFVPWAVVCFLGLQSLKVPYVPRAAPKSSDRSHTVFTTPALQPGDLFYRFKNSVDMPSLVGGV
ncbi:hypothetical protein BDN71DRAFT_1451521 [Pleurotus eryngii]|uniref:Uncharacterized protein n=1 Tax=Pleurotus eryngii TaxID=5323 RepID=A0A9P5ZRQ5_PLEER|nr:hypothetical protein BDN71DRAFT_1451521 [Pleurotus eryngii]